jgi:hypothetical protein
LGVGAARKVFPQSTGCFYLFLDHGSFIYTKSASAGTFSGNCRVPGNDTSTFCTACPDLTSFFFSFVTLHFTASAEPTVTIFIRAALHLSTLTWLVFL